TCQAIAKLIVRDGEGVTKLVHLMIRNAVSTAEAEKAARSIADSYLVKTAIFGQSPNWGRIIAAIGYSGAKFDLSKLRLMFNELVIFENGDVVRKNESSANSELITNEIDITVDLGTGTRDYFMWTSDLSYDYVKINAHYI